MRELNAIYVSLPDYVGLYGILQDDEPEIGEQFSVPRREVPSGVAEATNYRSVRIFYHPKGPKKPIESAGWAIHLLPVIENPCDKEHLKAISS